jgi:hypothetical protein
VMYTLSIITFIFLVLVSVLVLRVYKLVKFTDLPQLLSTLAIFFSLAGKYPLAMAVILTNI